MTLDDPLVLSSIFVNAALLKYSDITAFPTLVIDKAASDTGSLGTCNNSELLWRLYPQEPELRGTTNQNH